nr:uncharacterized protein LOC109752791 [Aegilops tauschii subsp. strangulata]
MAPIRSPATAPSQFVLPPTSPSPVFVPQVLEARCGRAPTSDSERSFGGRGGELVHVFLEAVLMKEDKQVVDCCNWAVGKIGVNQCDGCQGNRLNRERWEGSPHDARRTRHTRQPQAAAQNIFKFNGSRRLFLLLMCAGYNLDSMDDDEILAVVFSSDIFDILFTE